MITEEEIVKILEKYKTPATKSWEEDCLQKHSFERVAEEILGLLSYYYNVENAELKAKVKAYEAIIENSNFKMAVIRKRKEEE